MPTRVRAFVRSLGLDAYVVGGAVRDELLGIPHVDEDFLVLGVDHDGLREALAPHGRVEELVVHGQRVGIRLHPRERELRRLVPAGIELTPPRVERSTGPGHKDFAIVADAAVGLAEDLGRRDFTINAMARSLATGALVDPFGGLTDLARRELRTVSETSFEDDPLRILRGLRLVSQLGFTITGAALAQMRRAAPGLAHVSPERIGGGLAADGNGELSKLLLGRAPATALRLARETGVLRLLIPEFGPAIGHELGSDRQPVSLDEHLIEVVEGVSEAGGGIQLLLAALLHDLGKPHTGKRGGHAALGSQIAASVLSRLRYPVAVQRRVERLVAAHAFHLDPWLEPVDGGRATRRFLRDHGAAPASELVVLKAADLAAKRVPPTELAALARLRRELDEQASASHRLADLAVTGEDLKTIGFEEGPVLGEVLRGLLDRVVDDPSLNDRATLLRLAQGTGA